MKTILLMAGISGLMALSAAANTISYSTTGVLSCGAVANCSEGGGGTILFITAAGSTTTLVYTGASATNLSTPSNISLGLLDVSSNAANPVSLSGATLLLSVTQTNPGAGSLPFGTGSATGSITINSSSLNLNFASPTSFVLGNEQYTILSPTSVPAPNSNSGQVTIQGLVSDVAATPEPGTLVLMGAGLGLVGLLRRRIA